MEVGDDEDYHFAFDEKKEVVHIPTELSALEEAFAKYHDRLNCFIVEPLLQGAGGMRMYDISFLKRARQLCSQYDVLLIFDEVATGFGRTGHRFVADVVLPDILVLGKALTGGYIGHAVTVANHKVFQGFYSDNDRVLLGNATTYQIIDIFSLRFSRCIANHDVPAVLNKNGRAEGRTQIVPQIVS